MKPKTKLSDVFFQFIVALMLILSGVFLLIKKLVVGGIYSRNNQETGFGGWLLILFGVILLVVAYYTLSPFSKIRQFFEGNSKNKDRGNSK